VITTAREAAAVRATTPMCTQTGLALIEKQPGQPIQKGGWTPAAMRRVAGCRRVRLCGDSDGGVHVVDGLDPANPVLRGGYLTEDWPTRVAVAGTLAYVAAGPRWRSLT